ncbi:MAG: hypothetical protein N3G19_00290 [Candidatus Pacearchaeota archaeon]|nr:hypothetical protein [Candidatus Pacearchaeota archaeon]
MNKVVSIKFFIVAFAILLIFFAILIQCAGVTAERHARIEISLLNQDPYPAQPNSYVELVFKVENTGGVEVHDVFVELLPQYPFSLDDGSEAIKKIGTLSLVQYEEKAVFIKYRVRVDKDAIDGENKIKLRYIYDSNGKWENYVIKEFNVTVEDPKTDFDVAIQDYSPATGTLSIAVSNIGKQDAKSVSIMLPEQSSIEIVGSNKEIVGGIEQNDYTTASFKVIPKEDAPIIVRISYTDFIGIRREVEKAVLFKASGYNYKINREAKANNKALIYICIGVVGIIVILMLLRILKKRRKT